MMIRFFILLSCRTSWVRIRRVSDDILDPIVRRFSLIGIACRQLAQQAAASISSPIEYQRHDEDG